MTLSFTVARERRNTSNPRSKALKFAQEVHDSVVHVCDAKYFEPKENSKGDNCKNPTLVEYLRMF